MYASLSMDHEILKEVLEKKYGGGCERRKLAKSLVQEYQLSVSQSCRIAQIDRKTYYYKAKRSQQNEDLKQMLKTHATTYTDYGFDKLFELLKAKGCAYNHKRIYRLYCELGYPPLYFLVSMAT